MDQEKRLVLYVKDHIEQVNEEIYKEYCKMRRREQYLEERDLVHGKCLYSQFDNVCEGNLGEEMIVDIHVEDICDAIVTKIMIEKLKECLLLLSDEELNLITQLFYEEKSQRRLSAESGIPLMTISNRKKRILKKLKKYLEK